MSSKTEDLRRAFAAWLDTPENLRSVTSEEAWAAANNVTSRTLRRWKQDPAFAALRVKSDASTVETSPLEDDGSDEASYRVVKARLVEGARSGNAKSLELYFKTYGKPFVEEEVAARTLDLENVELPGLVARAAAALAPEELEAALVGLGWKVERPAGG